MTRSENTARLFERIRFRGNPIAHRDAMVISDNARFTVLAPRLLRLEWSETGEFEDRGTYAFPTRYVPTPAPFKVEMQGDQLIVDTGLLLLRYTKGSPFTADTLSISFEQSGNHQVWTPGMPNPSNLRGTRRTLDECEGDAALEKGLLARDGWSLFDDSQSVVFNHDDGWVAPRHEHALVDWYFFCYGHDYKGALAEYTRFGGAIPMIPRFVLGAWWSRYWAYSAQDLQDLVGEFEAHDIPLDVLVIDMDWHTPHAWTGYTWNRELFPDPPGFLRWVHDKGLRATLNLHPAQGIQHFEEIYPRFAREMGIDPKSKEKVPFQITNKQFVQNYFELIHHPMEEDGVDFWWIDWQQGEISEMKGLDPLPWINHLHFQDSVRRGKRPMLYSRWGGLGNHRYHIGFSGDTIVGWPALQFQPYFTATASNVVYGWWSHDIGGHMGGATEPELYARWVQFGAVSPCLRMHATKDPRAERRPWKYPPEVYRAAKAAFHLRYQLVPYLYTMARKASDSSIPLCRPMYYEYPEQEAAYAARYQYFFGDEVIAAPIVHPADPETGMATTDVWVPEGTWIEYTTKETFTGPRWARMAGDIDRIPMLVQAGAILPLAPAFRDTSGISLGSTDAIPHDQWALSVFPEADGTFRVYEDDGTTEAYKQGDFEWTEIHTTIENEHTWIVEIEPVEGHCTTLPLERQYMVCLQGSARPDEVMVDGAETKAWTYNPLTWTTTIYVPQRDKRQPVQIAARSGYRISALGETHNKEIIRADVRRLLGAPHPVDIDDVDSVLRQDASGRTDAVARLGGPFARIIEFTTPEETRQQLGRVLVSAPQDESEPYDLKVTFTLFRNGTPEQHTVKIEQTNQSHVVDTPFAFDGQVQTMHWEAEVQITWRGATLRHKHSSSPLFPSIYAWQTLVYNENELPLPLGQIMDERGRINDELDWCSYRQSTADMRNLNQPYGIRFDRDYRHELQAGQPLASYLATTVISPNEREALLQFRTVGSVQLYLNGQEIAEAPLPQEQQDLAPYDQTRRTELVHLLAGENTLVIHSRSPRQEQRFWFWGAVFTPPGPGLSPMTDLTFK